MMKSPKGKAICILGMHRSGTSAIARAVNLLGPYMGRAEDLMPSVEGDNPHGFWEHRAIFSFHERLLFFLALSWDSTFPPPEEWWKRPEIIPYREELKQLIREEFSGRSLWMWKDPRTCLLLPLWQHVLRELGIEVYYLLCMRNPVDVASSLLRRNSFPKSKSSSLWLLYNLSALHWTSGARRIFVNYDDLMEDWERPLRKVSAFFGIPWPRDESEFRKAMMGFIRPEERHSHSDAELLLHDAEVAEPVKKIYRLILEALEKNDLLDSEAFSGEVEDMYRDYCAYARMLAPRSPGFGGPGWCRQVQKINTGDKRDKAGCAEAPDDVGPPAPPSLPEEIHEMVFPAFSACRTSIIIPVWNHCGHSYRCLQSILANTDEATYEVIVVDNGSSDETGELLSNSANIKVIRNQSNQGYLLACNQGAGSARGEYLLFLNNDTTVTRGWLESMTGLLDGDSTIGAVGAKLVFGNGALQEAGGIIWSDGSTAGYGRGEDPDDPEFCYRREVDYCSGACLLVRRDLFVNLGGFDETYSPAYYEDADLCLEIKRLGYRVVYQPEARIIHHEFGSGSKKKALDLYLRNMPLFAEKWGAVLAGQYSSHENDILCARESRLGKRILVIDSRDTFADLTAPPQGAHHFARLLAEFGYLVTLVSPLPRDDCRTEMETLQSRGIEVFCKGETTIEDFAKQRNDLYNALVVFAPESLQSIRKMFPLALVVIAAGAASEGASEEKIEQLGTCGADIIIAVSQGEGDRLTERRLHNVFVWEHSSYSMTSESRTEEHRHGLAAIFKKAFGKLARNNDKCGSAGRRDPFIHELQAKINEMGKYIRSLEAALPPKDEYISDLQRALSEKDEYIKGLERKRHDGLMHLFRLYRKKG